MDNHTHLESVLDVADGAGWRSDEPRAASSAWLDREPTVVDHLMRAAEVGVTRVVQVGCDLPSIAWTGALLDELDGPAGLPGARVVAGVAIHPNEAVLHAGVREVAPDGLAPAPRGHHEVSLDDAIAQVAAFAAARRQVRVIGETGLDFFRAGERGRAVQREAFRAHVALAKELGLVLQIHDRDAHADVVEVLLADGAPERTVFHCFSGDAELARLCAEHGWYLSFAGPVGYPASADLRAALHETPLERVLLETDAPYLPAHPWRGRPNAPYLLPVTGAQVASELGLDLGTLCARVSRTSEDLYGPW